MLILFEMLSKFTVETFRTDFVNFRGAVVSRYLFCFVPEKGNFCFLVSTCFE